MIAFQNHMVVHQLCTVVSFLCMLVRRWISWPILISVVLQFRIPTSLILGIYPLIPWCVGLDEQKLLVSTISVDMIIFETDFFIDPKKFDFLFYELSTLKTCLELWSKLHKTAVPRLCHRIRRHAKKNLHGLYHLVHDEKF